MYRDGLETHLKVDRSYIFAAAFLRNLRCSAVTIINVYSLALGVSDC